MKQSRVLIFSLITAGIIGSSLFAQEKTIILFHVEEASIDGENLDSLFKANKVYTVFYMHLKDSVLSMANVWPSNNSQSFGNVIPHKLVVYDESYQGMKATRSFYKWFYSNSYNDTKGSADIELIQTVKPEGIYYVMKMTTSDFSICTYKGYLNQGASNTISEYK